MRIPDVEQPSLFSYSHTTDLVPANHPSPRIRSLVVDAETTHASETTAVDVALKMPDRRGVKRRLTVGTE